MIFDFIDQEATRVHMDLADELGETRRDIQALEDENERLREHIEDLEVKIDALANDKSVLEGRTRQLIDDLSTARQETLAERLGAERERTELATVRHSLEALDRVRRELDRIRVDFDAQRQARQEAMREVAVLQTRKADLRERLAELKSERARRQKDCSPRPGAPAEDFGTDGRRQPAGTDTGESSQRPLF